MISFMIRTLEDFKSEQNKQILKKLYFEFEKGNSNINNILDTLSNEDDINYITKIMAEDYNIQDVEKAIIDLIYIYKKEKIINRRNEILANLEDVNITKEERASLEKELNDVILKLAKFK